MKTATKVEKKRSGGDGATSGTGRGRPKGSKNKGGPILSRIATRLSGIRAFEKNTSRFQRWSAREENASVRSKLDAIAQASKELEQRRLEIANEVNDLVSEGYEPPKVQTAAIDYTAGRQVWFKPAKLSAYEELYGEDVNRMFILSMIENRVAVQIGPNKAILPKLHLTVRNPSDSADQAA